MWISKSFFGSFGVCRQRIRCRPSSRICAEGWRVERRWDLVMGKPDKADDGLGEFRPRIGPRPNARRVVVKAHVQKLGRHGAQAAARHLRYIERDGGAPVENRHEKVGE
jgi:hypothetical protein